MTRCEWGRCARAALYSVTDSAPDEADITLAMCDEHRVAMERFGDDVRWVEL